MSGSILIVEDEPVLLRGLRDTFVNQGWDVATASDGEKGLELALTKPADVILLDIMLPRVNGYEICRAVRERGVQSAILMLTAKGQEEDVILGLNLGADDYLTKPFSPRELVARMKAIFRRTEPQERHSSFSLGDVMLDKESHDVTVGGKPVELTAKEFDLLAFFMANTGLVVSRDVLLDRVWGQEYPGGTRTVDVHVAQLRRKLGRPDLIRTLRGTGYKAMPQ